MYMVKSKKIKFTNVAKKKIFQQINSNSDLNLGKCYLPNDLKHNKMSEKKNSINFFHLNISSFPYNFSELDTLLALTEIKFDITEVAESRLKRNRNHLTIITLPNYNLEHCPTYGFNRE